MKKLKPNQMWLAYNKHYEFSWRIYKSMYEAVFVSQSKEEAEEWAKSENIQLLPAPRWYVFNPLSKV